MVRVNSKKYFYESIRSSVPDSSLLKNPKLIEIVIDILSYSVPTPKATLNTPEKLKDYYESQAELLIEKRHRISTDYQKFQEEAYREILEIVRGKIILTPDELHMIKFLEQEAIEIGLYRLLRDYSEDEDLIKEHIKNKNIEVVEDIEMNSQLKSLDWLRRHTPRRMHTTACYHCGKVLKRHNAKKNSHFCSKRENLKCFLDIKRFAKQEQIEWGFIRGDQRCAHCKKPLNVYANLALNSFHNGSFFCPKNKYSKKNCYEAFRKKHQRDTSKNTYIKP